MMQGKRITDAAGIPDDVWEELVQEVAKLSRGRRATHPLAGMF